MTLCIKWEVDFIEGSLETKTPGSLKAYASGTGGLLSYSFEFLIFGLIS